MVGEKCGRLANRLWLFAHVIAHASEHGYKVLNPCFDEYSDYFAGTRGTLVSSYPPVAGTVPGGPAARAMIYRAFSRLVTLLKGGHASALPCQIVTTGVNDVYELSQPGFRRLAAARKIIVLAGWRFRDYDAFEKHSGSIRRYFVPSEAIAENVEGVLRNARANADILIGVHMRAGDYRTFLAGRFYFSPGQYRLVMNRVLGFLPNRKVGFLICSDEPLDTASLRGIDYSAGSGHAVEDLHAFAGCDFLVGPPSTYTMWASFYGEVPLLVVRDPYSEFSLSDFSVVNGTFDRGADDV